MVGEGEEGGGSREREGERRKWGGGGREGEGGGGREGEGGGKGRRREGEGGGRSPPLWPSPWPPFTPTAGPLRSQGH